MTPVSLDQLFGRGYSLIPTKPDKKPFFKWEPYQTTKPTREQLIVWHREHKPSGWAVITGSVSSIITLDFDGPAGVELMDWLGLRAHRLTPSGGRHVDFQHPGWRVPTLNSKSKPELGERWPGLDIRADGGYAVCYGKTDKGEYQWLREPDPEPLSILPEDLRVFLGLSSSPRQSSQPDPIPINNNRNHSARRVDSEKLIQKALSGVDGPSRNQNGFWLAGQLRDNGYSKVEAESPMLSYCSRCPKTNTKGQIESYTEAECLASLRSAYERSPREAWNKGQNRFPVSLGASALNLDYDPLESAFVEPPEPPPFDQEPPSCGISRPRIVVNNRQLRAVSDDAVGALRSWNNPPKLYAMDKRIVRVTSTDEGRTVTDEVQESGLRGCLSRSADYVRISAEGDDRNVSPPIDVVRDLLGLPIQDLHLPPLVAIAESPVVLKDGRILATPGYDRQSQLFYAPQTQVNLTGLGHSYNRDDAKGAREYLERELLSDFRFVDDDNASLANALAAILTPIIRHAVKVSPMGVIDATDKGNGKGLLANIVSLIATGRTAQMRGIEGDESENRKVITSILLSNPAQIIVFDNVTGTIRLPALERALTAELVNDRELGRSRDVCLAQRASWLMTGNNVSMGGDLPRRVYRIRMDAKTAQAYLRTGFRHEHLTDWVFEHRNELLIAILTMVRAWQCAGSPKPTVKPIGSFEQWTITVGGILEFSGCRGFLGNFEAGITEMDSESSDWAHWLAEVEAEFPDGFTVPFLLEQMQEQRNRHKKLVTEVPMAVAKYLDGKKESTPSIARSVGMVFTHRKDRRFLRVDDENSANREEFWLSPISAKRPVQWIVLTQKTDQDRRKHKR